jgi:hypothetical protein
MGRFIRSDGENHKGDGRSPGRRLQRTMSTRAQEGRAGARVPSSPSAVNRLARAAAA